MWYVTTVIRPEDESVHSVTFLQNQSQPKRQTRVSRSRTSLDPTFNLVQGSGVVGGSRRATDDTLLVGTPTSPALEGRGVQDYGGPWQSSLF